MSTARHYGMDWLRIGAFALLIFYHIGMYFVPWGWHVKIAQPLEWVEIPMLATNSWRLALLFLVSGYASAALFAKLGGSGAFVRSRSARLLVPLLFGILVIIPPQPWIELVSQHGYAKSLGAFWTSDYFHFGVLDGIVLPTYQHLWFVVYLWVYTMLAAAVLAWVPVAVRAKIADGAARLLGGFGLLIFPMLWWILLFFVFDGHEDTHALIDDGPAHLHYLMAFFIGWLLRVRPALFAAVARWWRLAAMLGVAAFAAVATILILWQQGLYPPDWARLPFDIARLVQGWATIVALIGVADAYANRDHPRRAMLAEAVFPFYIIHQTIIVVVGWWLLKGQVAALPSFLILVAATVTGCWLFYWIGRSIGWLRPLIGLQRR
ncbi:MULTISPECIES: acyltransferase family protein [unclassified Sphingopyxis]|uniref:acyltransferase family protein n=1 Tax=unclassified Sphingopyxis TaxID=2614943 RepID=UPI0007365D2E|nr:MULTISPECIES: acyltransferase family protein [unclassified Sphingopyxis]KTE26106.1 hypothetical protein ATE62_22160 [Sphingopyxis sp. HIX]KTE73379.1 hypothetical protein ATE72_21875 [Sphingopyxis sp. HXXIV]